MIIYLKVFVILPKKKKQKKGNQKLKGYQNGLGDYSHWYTWNSNRNIKLQMP